MRILAPGSSDGDPESPDDRSNGSGRRLYDQIYELVCLIPEGKVATYGQIAAIVGGCTPRQVGYAMAATPASRDIPWHRVINSRGGISTRRGGDGHVEQRILLEAEGIAFDQNCRVDLCRVGWSGPVGV